MRGLFITFEGVEGAGKSTQISLLRDHLERLGIPHVATREPGGTEGAEAIRNLLVQGDAGRWTDLTECLLVNAARAEHLDRLIRPALAEGKVVLCDRFMDSTRAYQGYAGGLTMETISELERTVVWDTRPDMTLIFDLSAEEGLARADVRGGAARFESKGLSYHRAVRNGFLDIAGKDPGRCHVIDAGLPVDGLAEQISTLVLATLKNAGLFNA